MTTPRRPRITVTRNGRGRITVRMVDEQFSALLRLVNEGCGAHWRLWGMNNTLDTELALGLNRGARRIFRS